MHGFGATSRPWMIAALAVGLAACGDPLVGGGPVTAMDGGANNGECAPNETTCDEECVYLLTDVANCGGCGVACGAGEDCILGECTPDCDDTVCGGECVDLTLTAEHCGRCDNACPAERRTCRGGFCRPTCGAEETLCTDVCADVSSDPMHCGECRNACADGETCTDGACG